MLCVLALAGLSGRAVAQDVPDLQTSLSDAHKRIAAGDLRGAMIDLRNAVRASPDDPSLYVQLATLYLELDAPGAAESEARLAIEKGAADADVAPVLAQSMLAQMKYGPLINLIKPGARPPKIESQVRLILGRAHLALGEQRFAEPMIQDAMRLDPTAVGPVAADALLLISEKDLNGATAALARARAMSPDDVEVLRADAELKQLKGDEGGALVELDAVIARKNDDIDALALRAAIHLNRGELDLAGKDVDRLDEINPNLVMQRYLSAVLSAKKGDLPAAEKTLGSISEFLDGWPEGLYLKGVIELRLANYDAAVDSLKRYQSVRPDDVRARYAFAMVALRTNQPVRAIDSLQSVIAANPADEVAAALIARSYLALGDNDRALAYYGLTAEAIARRFGPHARNPTSNAVRVATSDNPELVRAVGDLTNIDVDEAGIAVIRVLTDMSAGAMVLASDEAEALVKKNPNDVLMQDCLALIRFRQKRFPEAETLYNAVIATAPTFIEPRRGLARVYLAEGRKDDAGAVLRDVIQRAESDASAYYGLAHLAIDANDIETAVQYLQSAQRATPNDPSAGIEIVRLYADRKDWAKAKQAATTLLILFHGNLNAVDAAAQMNVALGDMFDAKFLFDQYLKETKNAPQGLARYARLLSNAGDDATARDLLVRAVAADPNNPQYLQWLTDIDDKTKGADEALKTARSYAQTAPDTAALVGAGILVRVKRPKDAIAELAAAQKVAPSSDLVAMLAPLMIANGDVAGGQSLLESWVASHGDDWEAQLQLGNLYAQQNQNDKAFAAFQAIESENPNNVLALNNLAYMASKKSDPRGLGWAERAYYLSPTAEAADTYGWILASGGKAAAGLPFLKEAGTALPNEMTVQYHLAYALDAVGEKTAARDLLARTLKASAGFDGRPDAVRLYQQLE